MAKSKVDEAQLRKLLEDIQKTEAAEAVALSFKDPWFFLTGYELGDKWTPGESKGVVWTLDEHDKMNPIKRFPNKKYLWQLVKLWVENPWLAILKSRRLMVTWLFTALRVWEWMGPKGALIFFQNKKLEDSKEMLVKAKFIYEHLPLEVKALRKMALPESSQKMEIEDRFSRIIAIPQGPDVLRQHTARDVFSDETSFQDEAEKAFSALRPTLEGGGRMTMQSTPNGKEWFWRTIWNDGNDEEQPFTEVMRGFGVRKNKNGFVAVRLHYSADPDKDPATERGRKWKEDASQGMTQSEWDREYELATLKAGGKRVYPGFNRAVHGRSLQWNPELTLYRDWDFGRSPAAVWWQIDTKGRMCVLREYTAHDKTIFEYAPEIIRKTEEYFPGARVVNFVDPAGDHKSDLSEKTEIDILRTNFGVRCHFQRMPVATGIAWITKLMEGDQETTRFLVDVEKCPVLTEGFESGYVTKQNDPDTPETDDVYEHPQDGLRIGMNNTYRKFGLHKKPDKKEDAKQSRGRITYGSGKTDQFTGY